MILYLAAAGIGTIGIVDFDTVSLSNLQRQIAHRTADVGRLKTASAGEAAQALNPGTKIEAHNCQADGRKCAGADRSQYDIVADGSDNFATRFLINDACYLAGRTLVSSAVSEFDGQLATYKAHDKSGAYPCYRCLFPEPPPAGTAPSCSETGVLGAAAGVMGTLQALEVLKEILGIGRSMAGRLLIYDALAARFRDVAVKPDPACALCGNSPTIHSLTTQNLSCKFWCLTAT